MIRVDFKYNNICHKKTYLHPIHHMGSVLVIKTACVRWKYIYRHLI